MTTTTVPTVPVTVDPEAAARVAELGMQRELEAMLDHTRQAVPGLRAIRVEFDPRGAANDESSVILWTHRDDPGPGPDPTSNNWDRWFVETFPPEVCWHFVMLSIFYEAPHGR